MGFPLTSAPVAFFIALAHGTAFAAAVAAGVLAGTISQAAFSVAYARVAARVAWVPALLVGSTVFAVLTAALDGVDLPLLPLLGVVIVALVVAIRLLPREPDHSRSAAAELPGWDIPARMIVATAFVLVLTGVASRLGAHLTGLLSPFPLYAAVLTVFAHRLQGARAAVGVLRGLLIGLFAYAVFFAVLAALIDRIGIAASFAAAIGVTLAVQAGSLWTLRLANAANRAT